MSVATTINPGVGDKGRLVEGHLDPVETARY